LLGATTDRRQVEAALARADDVMTALSAMEMVGGAQRVLEMTIEYVSGRTQFDRPIGSFQAVQHHAADMAISVHGARLAALQAMWLVSERLPASRELAIAKSAANDTYTGVTLTAHQLHGGMGVTREHDLHLWSEQARAASLRLGTSDHHLDTIRAHLTAPNPTASGLVGG
jgi:alkylation response protein AidB-like acyl-CoA dehydrogenase